MIERVFDNMVWSGHLSRRPATHLATNHPGPPTSTGTHEPEADETPYNPDHHGAELRIAKQDVA